MAVFRGPAMQAHTAHGQRNTQQEHLAGKVLLLRFALAACCVCVACDLHGRATQETNLAYALPFDYVLPSQAIGLAFGQRVRCMRIVFGAVLFLSSLDRLLLKFLSRH